jgi:hypothetical protein
MPPLRGPESEKHVVQLVVSSPQVHTARYLNPTQCSIPLVIDSLVIEQEMLNDLVLDMSY